MGEKVPSRVRLRAKTPDESFNRMKEEEDEKVAGTSSKEPGGASQVEAYGGGQELVGTSGADGQPTSTAVAAHNRHASPPPKRMRSGDLPSTPGSNSSQKKLRQLSIAAMFGSPNCEKMSFSSDEQQVQEIKGKLKEKLSFAEKEAILKQKFEAADMPYVPNGTRDRFDRPRSNVGGRPKKTDGLHRWNSQAPWKQEVQAGVTCSGAACHGRVGQG